MLGALVRVSAVRWYVGVRPLAARLALVTAVALGTACGGDASRSLPRRSLGVAAGNPGGVYFAYGGGLARSVERHLEPMRARVLRTDGSVANLRLVAAGRADLGFAIADAAADAVAGRGRFAEPLDLVALARLYDNYVQVFVRARDGRKSLTALAGRRVSVGSPGSGTRLVADRILASAGLRGARAVRRLPLDLEASANALAEGRIDAFFWSGGLPTEAITRLRRRTRIALLDLTGVAAVLRRSYGDVYSETRVPRNVYGLPRAVTSVSVPNLLVVRSDLDPEIAYRVTRLLFEHRDELEAAHPEATRLSLRAAIATFPLSLHPGAARWYRQARR